MLRWGSPGRALQEHCVIVQCFGHEILGLDKVGSAGLDLAVLSSGSLKGAFAHL